MSKKTGLGSFGSPSKSESRQSARRNSECSSNPEEKKAENQDQPKKRVWFAGARLEITVDLDGAFSPVELRESMQPVKSILKKLPPIASSPKWRVQKSPEKIVTPSKTNRAKSLGVKCPFRDFGLKGPSRDEGMMVVAGRQMERAEVGHVKADVTTVAQKFLVGTGNIKSQTSTAMFPKLNIQRERLPGLHQTAVKPDSNSALATSSSETSEKSKEQSMAQRKRQNMAGYSNKDCPNAAPLTDDQVTSSTSTSSGRASSSTALPGIATGAVQRPDKKGAAPTPPGERRSGASVTGGQVRARRYVKGQDGSTASGPGTQTARRQGSEQGRKKLLPRRIK